MEDGLAGADVLLGTAELQQSAFVDLQVLTDYDGYCHYGERKDGVKDDG